MEKSPRLFIIDGSSYIFRAYYAIRPLSTSKGIPTNATYGFTQMLLKLLKEEKPEYLVMVFDTEKPSFRKKEYEAYKANRQAPPEDLLPQFDYIKKAVRALNIPLLEAPGFEADDIIATIVRKILPNNFSAVIVTGDKDLMQLVNEHVQLLDTMKDKRTGLEGVAEKFGVGPDRVVDVLALSGDSSDNVPGVPGIGLKTATQLIQKFGSLDELYEQLNKVPGKKQEILKKFRDQAYLSKRLVTLCDEVSVSGSLEDFVRREPHAEECRKLFEELEFHRLLEGFGGAKPTLPKKGYQLVQSDQDFRDFLKKLRGSNAFAFDTETTSLDTSQAKLVGLSFALKPGEAYYLPVGHRTQETQLDLEKVLRGLKEILEDSKIKKYAQNFKYDAAVLANYQIKVQGLVCDTMLAAYLLEPASSHRLDFLSLKYLNHKMISFTEVTEKVSGGNFAEVSLQDAANYSCEDSDVTFQLAERFQEELKKEKLGKLLTELEQPLTEVLMKMEGWGVQVDIPFLKSLQKEFGERMAQKEKYIYELAGEKFNIQSPKQLGFILFEKLKLPALKKTKTGFSTDVDVLTDLSKSHRLPQEILDFRSLAKLKSTYIDALILLGTDDPHRIHTSFNQTVAETGRLSSSDPNLQNIPIRTEDGAKIRRAFIAEQGFTLMSADYSQIELRILAHLSEDPVLLDAFKENLDIHRLTAAGIFNVKESLVTAPMRGAGKTVNFAVIYGQTPYGLSGQLGVSQTEAKKYIDQYFEKYKGVYAYREKILAQAREQGEVRTLLGRRRFVPEITSKNFASRGLGERIAFNTVIQGTAADIIKQAMLAIDRQMIREKLSSRMLLQVHDELIFELENSERDRMKDLVRDAMENVVNFRIPLKVDMGVGKNWGEAHR